MPSYRDIVSNRSVFHPAQSEIAADRHRFRVVNCGRRFGKTYLSVQEMLTVAQNTKEGRIIYIAPTYKQAKDIAWEQLKKCAQPIIVKANESSLEMTVRSQYPMRDPAGQLVLTKNFDPHFVPSTSKIILRGWEAVESLRGQSYHFVILDEVASMKYFDYSWKTVIFPTLTDYCARVLFLSTPKGFNHFYDLFNMEGRDNDFKSFCFPSTANPHLPKEALEKARIALSPEQYAQEYEAEFKRREGLVFNSFSRDRNTYNPNTTVIPPVSETFYGIDFGFTNPSGVVVVQKDRDRNYWITEELYRTQTTNTQLIELVKSLSPKPRYIYADPAEPDRIKEFQNAGFYSREVKKGKNSIISGIDRLQELFKTGRIRISLACPNLISELEVYAYPDKKENHNEAELPIDEDNHLIDALRYALVTHDPATHGQSSVFGDTPTSPLKKLVAGVGLMFSSQAELECMQKSNYNKILR